MENIYIEKKILKKQTHIHHLKMINSFLLGETLPF
jgi:hypothetical protein